MECVLDKSFYNLIVPSAVMQHSFGNPVKVKTLRKERYVQILSFMPLTFATQPYLFKYLMPQVVLFKAVCDASNICFFLA